MITLMRLESTVVLLAPSLGEVIEGKKEIAAFLSVMDMLGYNTPDTQDLFDDLDAMWEHRPVGETAAMAEFDIFSDDEAAPLAA